MIPALLSDNIATIFLMNKKYNFETLYQYSHFASYILIIFSMLIPKSELNLFAEIFAVFSKIKKYCSNSLCYQKKSQIYHEMISLNQTETQPAPKESFENISILTSNREQVNEETSKQSSDNRICLFTLSLILFCIGFSYFDLFAKMKRLLSLMDCPKIIDFFNYPVFCFFLYVLIGSNNKNLYMDRRRKIKQSKN